MTLDQSMTANGMTDQQLAEAVGVSREAVRLWRSGQRRIAAERVAAVSAATGIPAAELRPDLAAAFATEAAQ
jgi:DNA-binding transcriptional regulator YdaS (Cro superfamily)